jgi:hypothetical protein
MFSSNSIVFTCMTHSYLLLWLMSLLIQKSYNFSRSPNQHFFIQELVVQKSLSKDRMIHSERLTLSYHILAKLVHIKWKLDSEKILWLGARKRSRHISQLQLRNPCRCIAELGFLFLSTTLKSLTNSYQFRDSWSRSLELIAPIFWVLSDVYLGDPQL